MAHLDDELAQTLAGSGGHVKQPAPRGHLGLLVGLLVVAGGILALILSNTDDSAIYSKDVALLLAQAPTLKNRKVNLQGTLVTGSLTSNLACIPKRPCEYRFVLHGKNGQKLPVRYAGCVLPDSFRDSPTMDVAVTATGKLTMEGAENIMVRAGKYEMKQRVRAGEAVPHQGNRFVIPKMCPG